MATLKGQTVAASYQDLVKRADTYSQTGTNIEIMNDSAVVQPTGLYLESGAVTDNVGIGTATPDSPLEISKDTDGEVLVLKLTNESDAGSTGAVGVGFDLEDTGGTVVDSGKILVGKENTFTATASTQDSFMAFWTSLNGTLAETMRLSSDGRLSFKSPTEDRSGEPTVGFGDGDTGFYESADDVLVTATAGSARMVIDAAGKVGIGTESPAKALHVVDSALVKGRATFTLTGSINVTGTNVNVPGTLTEYLTELSIGDDIVVSGETRTIASITNDTTATVTTAWGSDLANDTSPECNPAAFTVIRDAGAIGMILDDDGNVGIGTTAPDTGAKLHVHSATAGSVDADTTYADLTVENSDHGGINILTPADKFGGLIFGSPTANNRGYVKYNHTGDQLIFGAVGANKMIIDTNSRISLSNNDAGSTGGLEGTTGNTTLGYLAGQNIISGVINNTFIGHGVADATLTDAADGNTGVGAGVLTGLTSGDGNTCMGYLAGQGITSSTSNTLVGSTAGYLIAAGISKCVGIGSGSFGDAPLTADADGSVAVGHNTLYDLDSGIGNVAVGFEALRNEDDGDFNTAIGWKALNAQQGTSGTVGNTAVGYQSGLVVNTGVNNCLMGFNTGQAMTTGESNTSIGSQSLNTDAVGDNTTALGYAALYSQLTASKATTGNVGIGASAGFYNQDGTNNTLVGYKAGYGVTTKSYSNCVYIGKDAGFTAYTGAGNIAIGSSAMNDTNAGTTSGASENNIFVGFHAGGGTWANTQTDNVVALGAYALFGALSNVDGTIAIGGNALQSLTTGIRNTAVGFSAMKEEITGEDNTVVGYAAMGDSLGTGIANISNTFIGSYSGGGTWANTASTGNTAVGAAAMNGALDNADNNTVIGYASNPSAVGGQNQTVIGASITGFADNSVTLGNASAMAFMLGGMSKMMKISTFNLAASGSRDIVLTIGNSDGWVTGKLFVVCSSNDATQGGVYNVDFSARFVAGSATDNLTQTVVHSDRGEASANNIELNAPSVGTSTVTWALDNDNGDAMNRCTYTVQLFGQYDVIRYITLS